MYSRKIILINLIFFSIIISTVIYYYISHFQTLENEINSYIKIQANSIAKRIEISATNIVKSEKFVKNIIQKNLESQTKFIDLLNSVEPFNKEELKNYAEEAGLQIIAIFPHVIFSSNYLTKEELNKILKEFPDGIIFLKNKFLILYKKKGLYSNSTIITGIYSKNYFEKEKKLSLNALIRKILNQRRDIMEIKLINSSLNKTKIFLKDKFYIVQIPFEAEKGKIILIKIDAYYPMKILQNFKHNLYVFIFVMVLIGIIGNIFIFFLQKKYIAKISLYEKNLAKNEKDAEIGRSAGIIAHEIRNPLNAIGIGLQRILYETNISENKEYKQLIETILKELSRVNNTIESFLDYTKPLKINKNKLNLKQIILDQLIFYKNLSIEIIVNIPEIYILADPNLFKQTIANIVKNVIDNNLATYLKIKAAKHGEIVEIIIENNGIDKELDIEKIFQPYYTTKTKGSGLGLAIVKKIVEAHNGTISCHIENNKIEFRIKLLEA